MTSFTDSAIGRVTDSSAPTGKPSHQAAEPVSLEGSSPPGSGAPAFQPIANPEKRFAYSRLHRPMMRSGSQRLAELADEYERAIEFWNATATVEDDDRETAERRSEGEVAVTHASRVLRELEQMIQAIPAMNLRDLGLKARVVSWADRMAWSENEQQGLCNLADDVLLLAGMDRIRATDFEFAQLLPSYTGPERYSEAPAAMQPDAPSSGFGRAKPSTELERLATEYAAAADQLKAFDLADAKPKLDSLAKAKFQRLWNEAHDRVTAIEASATYIEATSAKDALFQTILAFGEVDSLHACANAVEGSETSITADVLSYRLDRLLYSIRGVLERRGCQATNGADATRWQPRTIRSGASGLRRFSGKPGR